MRALVQRVSEASVTVNGSVAGEIGRGLLVFLGVRHDDTEVRAKQLAQKVVHLRVFPDDEGKMNLSVHEVSGAVLIVSQFTLYGNTQKGNRPSYSEAAKPDLALHLYHCFVNYCGETGIRVETGIFQAHMQVRSINDGPVTLLCYSEA